MLTRSFLRPGRWIALVLGTLALTTTVSYVRAQLVPATTVTFQPGAQIPVRGLPMNFRPIGAAYSLGGQSFGGFPRPVQTMPAQNVVQQGFGRVAAPGFNFFGGGGQGGGIGGGGGISGGTAGGIGGGGIGGGGIGGGGIGGGGIGGGIG